MLIFGMEVPFGYTIGVVKLKLTNDFNFFLKFKPKLVSKPPNARLFILDACHSFNMCPRMLIFDMEVPLGYTIGVVKLKLTNDFNFFFIST